jgi:hypothetical protein
LQNENRANPPHIRSFLILLVLLLLLVIVPA